MHAWTLLKLAVWAAFLLVAPAVCLQRGLVGAAVLLGLLGLLLDVAALDQSGGVRPPNHAESGPHADAANLFGTWKTTPPTGKTNEFSA